jgi:diguanylate cyclase (GGDEF)-like protein
MRESTTDTLTGVFNRRYFHRRLRDQATRAAECGTPVGVLIGDIDRFKSVNDTYGHQTGDRLLVAVAEAIEGTVRGGDLVARYGGEEFVVLVDAAGVDGLRTAGERIRKAIAGAAIATERGPLSATIILGGCLGIPHGDLGDFEARLLAAADRCLYEAKSAGRNRVVAAQLPAASPAVPAPALAGAGGRRLHRTTS